MTRVWCATGHRPNKLGGYHFSAFEKLVQLARHVLCDAAEDLHVISGMALGWDQAWLSAAIDLGIPAHAAVPFVGQEKAWPAQSQDLYGRLLSRCASVTVVCDGGYAPEKMQRRNEWMVDRSQCVIALWDGSSGGTANCVRYAIKNNVIVHNVWAQYGRLPSLPHCATLATHSTLPR